jgi:hypothetical protein
MRRRQWWRRCLHPDKVLLKASGGWNSKVLIEHRHAVVGLTTYCRGSLAVKRIDRLAIALRRHPFPFRSRHGCPKLRSNQ